MGCNGRKREFRWVFYVDEGNNKDSGDSTGDIFRQASVFYIEREATIEKQLRRKVTMTQFDRAMCDLGVRMHKTFSPQAKGRIERLFRTLQYRFIAELRLRGINKIEGANRYLKKFINEYNRRFSVKPIEERKRPDGLDLDRILCKKEECKVKNDNTIS